ncbi:MAG TPA: polysaccharide biosynthesis tyrosine autokinase [Actinomycetota bacterium]
MSDAAGRPFDETSPDLRKYLQTLRARKWSVILTVILVVGVVLGFSSVQTPLYQAEARVLVRPLSNPGATSPEPVDVATEAQVVGSEPVARLARDQLETELSMRSLQGGLSVTGANAGAPTTSFTSAQVLVLEFVSADARFARDAVNAFADNYIEYRRSQALKSLLTIQDAVQNRINAASDQLEAVTEQLDEATEAGDQALANSIATQRSVLLTRLGTLQQRLDALQPDQITRSGGAEVIESASTPTTPVSPAFFRNAALAVFLGLALGVGLAFLRERLDDRFRGSGDVEEALDAPVLASIPKFASPAKGAAALVTTSETKSAASEAYRGLRTNLQFILGQQGRKSLVVTSPAAGEGKSVTTANLAVTLAKAGVRTVVVSADLRRPTLERYFGVDKRHGLATFLDGTDTSPWDVVKDPGIKGLRIVPSGPIPENPAELLVSPRLGQLVDFLEANSDLTLIDSPPILAVADAAIIASRVGGTVLVIDASSTARSASIHARDHIERGGGELVGVVLNSFDPQASPYYAPYATGYAPYESESTEPVTNGGGKSSGDESKRGSRSLFGRR